MLNRSRHQIIVAALAALLSCVAGAQQRDEYAQVKAKDLVKNPQLYWAQGIVFRDQMTAVPAGEFRTLAGRKVLPFRTATAGECYADEALVPALQKAGAGTECIFTATIFQETFWFKKSQFRIIVSEYSPVSAVKVDIRTGVSNLAASATSGPYLIVAQRLESIFSQVQSELAAFSAESSTPMAEIFNPTGPHRDRTLEAMRTAIARTEEEMRAPASVYLTELLIAILASQHGAPAPAAAEAPKPAVPEVEMKKPEPMKPADEMPPAKAEMKQNEPAKSAPEVNPTQPAPTARKPSFWSRLFGGASKQKPAPAAKPAQPEAKKLEATPASEPLPAR